MGMPEENPFAEAFGAALAARGLSLTALRRRLIDSGNPVAAATLSYWRSGERVPDGASSHAVVDEIERILGLPDHALIRLIPERVRVAPVRPSKSPFSDGEVQSALAETLQLLDAPALDSTRELTSLVVNDVAADGILRRRTAQTMIQSTLPETIDHVTYTLVSEIDVVDRPEITVHGARIVRDHLHASGQVYAYVMKLDQPLAPGASTMLEVVMEEHGEHRSRQPETGVAVFRPIRDLVIWTRFHPDAMPDWLEELESVDETGELFARPLRPKASVHQARRDFGPGALGIRWGYEGRWERAELP